MPSLVIKMENKCWMALFDIMSKYPTLNQEHAPKLRKGYSLMFDGINEKITYSWDLHDCFCVLIGAIKNLPSAYIEIMMEHKNESIIENILHIHTGLNDICEKDTYMLLGFKFQKNKIGIMIRPETIDDAMD